MLYVRQIRPGSSYSRAVLKRWRHRKERVAVRARLAVLPSAAASAWVAACDLDVARELVAIVTEE